GWPTTRFRQQPESRPHPFAFGDATADFEAAELLAELAKSSHHAGGILPRLAAVEGLGFIGFDAQDAVPHLKGISDVSLQFVIAFAAPRIGGSPFLHIQRSAVELVGKGELPTRSSGRFACAALQLNNQAYDCQ